MVIFRRARGSASGTCCPTTTTSSCRVEIASIPGRFARPWDPLRTFLRGLAPVRLTAGDYSFRRDGLRRLLHGHVGRRRAHRPRAGLSSDPLPAQDARIGLVLRIPEAVRRALRGTSPGRTGVEKLRTQRRPPAPAGRRGGDHQGSRQGIRRGLGQTQLRARGPSPWLAGRMATRGEGGLGDRSVGRL